MLDEKIRFAIEKLNSLKDKPIRVISHFDTDGITSAAIFSRALQRAGFKFSLKIVKGLESEIISEIPDDGLIIFLDLASGSLNYLKNKKSQIIILDHHEIISNIPENVLIVNPTLEKEETLCSAAICYLFAKALSPHNKDLSTLAVLGMIGDNHQENIGSIYNQIIQDSETTIKKGVAIYPSTRPLDKALEYSSNPYIPGVTGSYVGSLELLRDAKIQKENGSFKALYELSEEEMRSLVTAIMLRCIDHKNPESIIGNLYLVKFFNKLEDARELSALINACSRMDSPEISLGFCLGNKEYKEKAEKIYISYKQHLISALKFLSATEKIKGPKYEIINAKDNIKDTIIGTVASIVSRSPVYDEGTIIVALAYNKNKIKVSARLAGRSGRNVREVLNEVVVPLGGEVGGHPNAAGCLIEKDKESLFLEKLVTTLNIEQIKTNQNT